MKYLEKHSGMSLVGRQAGTDGQYGVEWSRWFLTPIIFLPRLLSYQNRRTTFHIHVPDYRLATSSLIIDRQGDEMQFLMGPGPLDNPADYLIEVTNLTILIIYIIFIVTLSSTPPSRWLSFIIASQKSSSTSTKKHLNKEKELSSRLIQYWTNFIYTGWDWMYIRVQIHITITWVSNQNSDGKRRGKNWSWFIGSW